MRIIGLYVQFRLNVIFNFVHRYHKWRQRCRSQSDASLWEIEMDSGWGALHAIEIKLQFI